MRTTNPVPRPATHETMSTCNLSLNLTHLIFFAVSLCLNVGSWGFLHRDNPFNFQHDFFMLFGFFSSSNFYTLRMIVSMATGSITLIYILVLILFFFLFVFISLSFSCSGYFRRRLRRPVIRRHRLMRSKRPVEGEWVPPPRCLLRHLEKAATLSL